MLSMADGSWSAISFSLLILLNCVEGLLNNVNTFLVLFFLV